MMNHAVRTACSCTSLAFVALSLGEDWCNYASGFWISGLEIISMPPISGLVMDYDHPEGQPDSAGSALYIKAADNIYIYIYIYW